MLLCICCGYVAKLIEKKNYVKCMMSLANCNLLLLCRVSSAGYVVHVVVESGLCCGYVSTT